MTFLGVESRIVECMTCPARVTQRPDAQGTWRPKPPLCAECQQKSDAQAVTWRGPLLTAQQP